MKNLKLIDFMIILAFILALAIGFLTYNHFRQTAANQVEATSKIAFQVYLRGVTITGGFSPVRPGDNTFITIRNVPYTNLKIINVKTDTKKAVLPNPKGTPPFILVDDFSQMFMYDIVVTVIDTAKLTKDGPVVGGNKIKIGLPITLEGMDYKFNGTVSNIQLLTDAQAKEAEQALEQLIKQSTKPLNPSNATQKPLSPSKEEQKAPKVLDKPVKNVK